MDRVAIGFVAGMLVLSAAAFFLLRGADGNQATGLAAPDWEPGTVFIYEVQTEVETQHAYKVLFPSGPHMLRETVIQDHTVHRSYTWNDHNGSNHIETFAVLEPTFNPDGQVHPWIKFPLRHDATWQTPAVDHPFLGHQPAWEAKVLSVAPTLWNGHEVTAWTIFHDSDGRSERIVYSPQLQTAIEWRTREVFPDGNGTRTVETTKHLVSITTGEAAIQGLPRDDLHNVVLNKTIELDAWYVYFHDHYADVGDPIAFTIHEDWDPWGHPYTVSWWLEEHGVGRTLEGTDDQVTWFATPGAFRIHVEVHLDGRLIHEEHDQLGITEPRQETVTCDPATLPDPCYSPWYELHDLWGLVAAVVNGNSNAWIEDQDGNQYELGGYPLLHRNEHEDVERLRIGLPNDALAFNGSVEVEWSQWIDLTRWPHGEH